ncbi:hypothetical protein [Microbacterium sp. KNMS]
MSAFSDRVLLALGAGFRRNAGPLLAPLVEALTDPVARTDELAGTTAAGWPVAFDLDRTDPAWIAQLVGVTPDPTLTPEQQREVIRTRPTWRAGTYRALLESIRTALTGLKRVQVSERDPNPWHAVIRVYESDYKPGTTRDTITALAERHRPAGMTFTYVFFPPHAYQEAEDVAGTYAEAEATAGTYENAEE